MLPPYMGNKTSMSTLPVLFNIVLIPARDIHQEEENNSSDLKKKKKAIPVGKEAITLSQ